MKFILLGTACELIACCFLPRVWHLGLGEIHARARLRQFRSAPIAVHLLIWLGLLLLVFGFYSAYLAPLTRR